MENGIPSRAILHLPSAILAALLLVGCATKKAESRKQKAEISAADLRAITPPGVVPHVMVGRASSQADLTETFFITPPPCTNCLYIGQSEGALILSWSNRAGFSYSIERKSSLTAQWIAVGETTGGTFSIPKTNSAGYFRYREFVASTPGALQWVNTITSGYPGFQAVSKAVAVDHANNVITVGVWQGVANLGAGNVTSSNNTFDAFIVKYTSAGAFMWAKQIGNGGYDEQANAIAVDSANNIILGGSFKGTVDFTGNGSGVQGTTKLTASQNSGFDTYDLFVAKYNASGTLLWVKNYGGIYQDLGTSIAVDASDRIFITENFQSPTVSFDGHAITNTGSQAMALARLSSGGVADWAIVLGGPNSSSVNGVAADKDGNAVLTGAFRGRVNFGGGNRVANLSFDSIFVAKFDGNTGAWIWDKAPIGNATAVCGGVGVTTHPISGNVIVTGFHRGTVNFGGSDASSPYQAAFLAGYSSGGAYLWNQWYGGDSASSGDAGATVTVNAAGKLFAAGHGDTSMYFGGPSTLFVNGFYLVGFTLTGNSEPAFAWAHYSQGGGQCGSVALDALGHITAAGSWQNTADFGGIVKTLPSSFVGAFTAQYNQ